MPKLIGIIVILAISIVILIGLVRQITSALDSGKRLDSAVEEVANLQEENRKLKKELEETEKNDFIEKIARDKLNLSKTNETVVIIDQKQIEKIIKAQKKAEEPVLTNWQGWLKLFFK